MRQHRHLLIRATLFGRLFLGNGFSWKDFIGYFFGCTLGGVLVVLLKRKIR
ncbi:MAG: DUF2809 domain-containing protein [Microcoleus sp. CAN_BIN18]|nr:DUF2809 domain-containing protein [Microcoleus sp. CAN_BIN18]